MATCRYWITSLTRVRAWICVHICMSLREVKKNNNFVIEITTTRLTMCAFVCIGRGPTNMRQLPACRVAWFIQRCSLESDWMLLWIRESSPKHFYGSVMKTIVMFSNNTNREPRPKSEYTVSLYVCVCVCICRERMNDALKNVKVWNSILCLCLCL